MSWLPSHSHPPIASTSPKLVDEPVVVDNILLTVTEAWELFGNLEHSLTAVQVDWVIEGF